MANPGSSELPSLLNITISQASEGLNAGHFTSVDLVTAYLRRIEEAASFKAVLQINPDALEVAAELDAERRHSGPRSPLHGLPILVKDNIVTKDALEASAGSFALLGAKPTQESSVVNKLRKAGVIILGKTNLSEWGNLRGLNVPGGWSPRGGQTLGAYYPNSKPEGSSSGSAVAAALGLCIAALGTETAGSIVDPAEINNVVGLKPTRGLIANDGTIPISARQDVIGTLTRTVEDAAYMLNVMAGRSDSDHRTWDIPFDCLPDYTTCCRTTNLENITIGVPRNAFPNEVASPIMNAFQSALLTFKSAGAKVVDNADFLAADGFKRLSERDQGIVISSEFKRDIVSYLQTLAQNSNGVRTVDDIIEFTKTEASEEHPAKDIGRFLWIQEESVSVDSDTYIQMVEQEMYFGGEGGILGAMDTHKLDIIVVPSTFTIANDLAPKMGFPIMAIPLGFWPEGTPIQKTNGGLVSIASGLPFCLTLITKAYQEEVLLRVACAFETLTGVRQSGPQPMKAPRTEIKDFESQKCMVSL